MRTLKVFRIYSSLPEAERLAFADYLASPYFKHPGRLVEFRALLEEALVQQPAEDLSPEEVWGLLSSQQGDFRANAFDKLCAELLAALNHFLAVHTLLAQPATLAAQQVEAYVDRALDEWVPGLVDSIREKLGPALSMDAKGLHAQMQIQENYAAYIFRQPRTPRGELLLQTDAQLNRYYFAKKLELAAWVGVYNRAFQAEVVLPYMDMLEGAIGQSGENFPLFVRLRALAYLLTTTREDRYYWEFKALLLASQPHEGHPDDLRGLFHLALNHCTYRINTGATEFEVETDDMHMAMLARGVLTADGRIPHELVKNIVQLRLLLGHVDWVADFLATRKEQISAPQPALALTYNEAVLAYHQQRFSDCVRGMETVLRDFKDDIYYGTDARIYLLMCLFERSKVEDTSVEMDSRLHAFRMYLLREQRIGETVKERYLNLVKQFRKLIALASEHPEARKAKAQKFLLRLKEMRPVSNQRWFQRQVAPWVAD